jgi:solute carrier family 25 (mitochondrial phosphate transporter), member 3
MPHRLAILAKEAGFRGLFAGLGPRMIMTAGLVSSQFLIYGGIKDGQYIVYIVHQVDSTDEIYPAMGAPPGLEIHKE